MIYAATAALLIAALAWARYSKYKRHKWLTERMCYYLDAATHHGFTPAQMREGETLWQDLYLARHKDADWLRGRLDQERYWRIRRAKE